MIDASFIFTILFLVLGPVKVSLPFLKATRDRALAFKRQVAIRAAILATIICLLVELLGRNFLVKYDISYEAVRIAGGLVLGLAALKAILVPPHPPHPPQPQEHPATQATANQIAIEIATPVIVAPVSVAAILIFVMLTPEFPVIGGIVTQSILALMVMDFLMMFFIDYIAKIPGLILGLKVFVSILVFIQVALGVDVLIETFQSLGVIPG